MRYKNVLKNGIRIGERHLHLLWRDRLTDRHVQPVHVIDALRLRIDLLEQFQRQVRADVGQFLDELGGGLDTIKLCLCDVVLFGTPFSFYCAIGAQVPGNIGGR